MMDPFDRAEEELERQYADGEITLREFNEEVRELYLDYQAAAREAAQNAYDREMENW